MSDPINNGDQSAMRDENGRFRRGNPGGPGRRDGSRNKATLALERIMGDDAEAVVKALIAAAKGGDVAAARLVLDRVLPARKGRPVELALPAIETAADVLRAQAAVIAAMAGGEVTPDEAAVIAGVLEAKRKTLETVELERRLAALEAAVVGDGRGRR